MKKQIIIVTSLFFLAFAGIHPAKAQEKPYGGGMGTLTIWTECFLYKVDHMKEAAIECEDDYVQAFAPNTHIITVLKRNGMRVEIVIHNKKRLWLDTNHLEIFTVQMSMLVDISNIVEVSIGLLSESEKNIFTFTP